MHTIFKSEILEKFGENLNMKALIGKVDPAFHRDIEIRKLVEILSRRNKSNAVLVGEPGVGKTAIIEELADRIVKGKISSQLSQKTIYSLALSNIVANTSYRGEFEERMQKILKEVEKHSNKIILFIDEIHNAIGAGAAEGSMDLANILKPAIARNTVQILGATTTAEYTKYIKNDMAFERRFQKISIEEPSEEIAVQMLYSLKPKIEKFHGIKISNQSLLSAVQLSKKYIKDRFLPDKAIDLLDIASVNLRLDSEYIPLALIKIQQQITKTELKEKMFIEGTEINIYQPNKSDQTLEGLKTKEADIILQFKHKKESFEKQTKLRKLIATYQKEAELNKKIGYPSKADEIEKKLIPKAQKELTKLEENFNLELSSEDIKNTLINYFDIDLNISLSDFKKNNIIAKTNYS